MKRWLPLLAILPAGLVIGLIGARLVDSDTPRASPGSQSALADAGVAPAYAPEANGADSLHEDAERLARGDRLRPGLDWHEEFWPEDHMGVSAGPYAHDEYYFGEIVPDAVPLAEARTAVLPRGVGEAEAAGAAAERAARDAARAAAAPPPQQQPSAASASPPATAPSPREPRTADGDLPAIW